MLKIAVCDDDAAELERTAALLRDYLRERPQLAAGISLFQSGQALLGHEKFSDGFDLYILDVIMAGRNGIQTGKALRNLGRDGAIIYLTTSPDYAVDSYLTQAFFYLLKPVDRGQLFQVLDRAAAEIRKRKTESVVVSTADGLRSLLLEDILYVELVDRVMRYYLAGGETVDSRTIRGSFRAGAAPLLADSRFFLCGASFVLNLRHVKAVERGAAVMDSGDRVAAPQTAYGTLKKAWMDHWLGGGSK